MIGLTPQLAKAARALLDWTQEDLSQRSGVSINTLRSFESGRTLRLNRENEDSLLRAFEAAGINFLTDGVGVRLGDQIDSGT